MIKIAEFLFFTCIFILLIHIIRTVDYMYVTLLLSTVLIVV